MVKWTVPCSVFLDENSGGLNTELNILKFGFPMVCLGMIGQSCSYSYGPDHSKSKPLKIWMKWPPFCSDFLWFWTKWPPFCSKLNTIGKPNTIGYWTDSSPHCNFIWWQSNVCFFWSEKLDFPNYCVYIWSSGWYFKGGARRLPLKKKLNLKTRLMKKFYDLFLSQL